MNFGAYGTDGMRSSSHVVSCQDENTKEILHCSFSAAAKKKKILISKIPVCLVPLPNVKAVTSKIESRDSMGYKLVGAM
jgi:predicted nucleotidyltransferase